MIAIIDYGMGNLRSVANAVERLGFEAQVVSRPEELLAATRAILPGVGAFGDCMRQLRERKLIDPLHEFARVKKRPMMGICLGMQVMASSSCEHGETEGLGWFDAEVVKLTPPTNGRIPHMGWNTLTMSPSTPDFQLFSGVPDDSAVYFVHSYWMKCKNASDVVATSDYGQPITAAINRENIFATQFHPEKSQEIGLQILKNFLKWEA